MGKVKKKCRKVLEKSLGLERLGWGVKQSSVDGKVEFKKIEHPA